MQCRSSPEGPPSCCLDPTVSVSPWRRVVVVKTLRNHTALTFPQPPTLWCGTRAAGPQSRSRRSPPADRSSEVWHSPPRSAKPYQEDPHRSTQLITAVPGPGREPPPTLLRAFARVPVPPRPPTPHGTAQHPCPTLVPNGYPLSCSDATPFMMFP